MTCRGRRGTAIAVVLLVLLAMQVLAHGVLLAARQELVAARAAVYLVQARAAAEGGVRQAVDSTMGPGLDSLALGATLTVREGRLGRARVTVTAERLAREAWLLQGRGEVDGWAGSVSTARLVWVLDPAQRVAAFEAVAHVGDMAAGPTVGLVLSPPSEPNAPEPACREWAAALDSLGVAGTRDPLAADTTEALRLGLLDRAFLLAHASSESADSVTPGPTMSRGRCDSADEHNWGDPRLPPGRCGNRFVLRARDGDLRVVGGLGQGVLVVTGDLSLEAGADFTGLVLVGGDVRLSDGSRIHGLARVGGAVKPDSTSRIVGSTCGAVRSIAAAEEQLRRPVVYPGWGWLTLR